MSTMELSTPLPSQASMNFLLHSPKTTEVVKAFVFLRNSSSGNSSWKNDLIASVRSGKGRDEARVKKRLEHYCTIFADQHFEVVRA